MKSTYGKVPVYVLDGVKGVFMRVKGKRNRRVVVMLEGIMGISAEVHPDLIEVIS